MNKQSQSVTNPAANQAASVALPAIASFEFQHQPVRVVMKDGVEIFIAQDLAPILGYKHAREAVRTRVDKRDRDSVRNPDAIHARGNPYLLAVNESDLYALVLGSKKPEALAFKRWITAEVLPSLRMTGQYEIESKVPGLLNRITEMLRHRGVAKARQLNRIVAHKDGSVSFRVGKHWVKRVQPLDACSLSLGHSLREGLALSALHVARKAERRAELH